MTEFYRALSVPVEEDLLPLSVLLHQHGVLHRVFEEGGQQVVMVERPDQVRTVQALYEAWRSGKMQIELSKASPPANPVHRQRQAMQAPVTLALVVLSICGFLVTYLPTAQKLVAYLAFAPFRPLADQNLFALLDHQYWRFLTPAFLHFSVLHVSFNCLWLWDLGKKIEQAIGHFNMCMLFVVIAIVSNTAQFVFAAPGLFGGMSGVVYGLLGFSWVAPLLRPEWNIRPSTPIMLMMVGWLLACLLGLVTALGFGAIANAAHVGGLVCGAVLGVLLGGFPRNEPRL